MEPSTCLAPSARLHLHRSALSSALLQFSDKTLCLQPNRFYNRSFSRHLPPHCVITATSDFSNACDHPDCDRDHAWHCYLRRVKNAAVLNHHLAFMLNTNLISPLRHWQLSTCSPTFHFEYSRKDWHCVPFASHQLCILYLAKFSSLTSH